MNNTLARIPCTIVTGFLGAGKTTLIRHVIANAQGRRLAVIVNEFGDVGIDGDILKGCGNTACPEENIVELANGCLCCTVADEFVPALDAILAREGIEHIVIETSGLALPKPLVQAFHWPAIKSRVTVDGVVVVVDGAALAEGRVANDLNALAQQRAANSALAHDDPDRGSFRGSDRLCRSCRPQQTRPDRRGRHRESAGRDRRCAAAHRQGDHGGRRQGRSVRCCSDSASVPRTISPTGAPITMPRKTTITTTSTHSSCRSDEIADPSALDRARRGAGRKFRRAARQRFCGGGRKAVAAAGAGGGRARDAPVRPPLDHRRGAPGPAWW